MHGVLRQGSGTTSRKHLINVRSALDASQPGLPRAACRIRHARMTVPPGGGLSPMDLTVPEIALLALVGLIAGLLPSTLAERRGIRLAADIGAGVAGVFVAAWLVASWRDLVPFSLTTPAGKPQEKVSVDLNLPNDEPVVLPLAPLRPLLKPVVFRSREEICERSCRRR